MGHRGRRQCPAVVGYHSACIASGNAGWRDVLVAAAARSLLLALRSGAAAGTGRETEDRIKRAVAHKRSQQGDKADCSKPGSAVVSPRDESDSDNKSQHKINAANVLFHIKSSPDIETTGLDNSREAQIAPRVIHGSRNLIEEHVAFGGQVHTWDNQ